jgi:hypothetical protein
MEPQNDLAFATSQELINELMRRKTFLGVVIHAEGDMRGPWIGEQNFRVHFNGALQPTEAGRLLATLADSLCLEL